jgi:tetratricopeptide (TPR) repeat protein
MQLVLPALEDVGIEVIERDFADLLPRFADDGATGKNRSLMASLEYSLRRLSEDERALLTSLAPFEGGALEEVLLRVTQIAEEAWGKLRAALERAALLRVERPHAAVRGRFLRFHPVLTPYLRARAGTEDEILRARYVEQYHILANDMYDGDRRSPQVSRALIRCEMHNLRRALTLLITGPSADDALDMAVSLAKFLEIFGYHREREQLRRQVFDAIPRAGAGSGQGLTWAEYKSEFWLAEDSYAKGDARAALDRYQALLQRIDDSRGQTDRWSRSHDHVAVLRMCAVCQRDTGALASAERTLQDAYVLVEALLRRPPVDELHLHTKNVVLADLGDVLLLQGKYAEARGAHEASLAAARAAGDPRGQAVSATQLGTIALQEQRYAEAKERFRECVALFKKLEEPLGEAVGWHLLGMALSREHKWSDAEASFLESLKLKDHAGDVPGAARTSAELAIVAENAGRGAEAELWVRQALKAFLSLGRDAEVAVALNNLADLIQNEVRAGRSPASRLFEARASALQALAIRRTLSGPSEIWTTFFVLASIAEQQGDPDARRLYQREERETYAAFPGNRFRIDMQWGDVLPAIAAATRGMDARRAVESLFPQLERSGWSVADRIRRIWAGERDWHTLSEGVGRNTALVILRVLETLAGATPPAPPSGNA